MAYPNAFEKYAQRYEAWYERNHFAYQSELRAIRTLLPRSGQGLEVGVGTGRFAEALGLRFGIDPARAMLALARQRGIQVVEGVAEALPFRDCQFGFLLLVTTICFLEDLELCLREAERVTEPKGALVIGFINRDTAVGKAYQQLRDKSLFYRGARFFSAGEVLSCLNKAGFRCVASAQTVFHNPELLREIEPVRRGSGEGCFTVVKGLKMRRGS